MTTYASMKIFSRPGMAMACLVATWGELSALGQSKDVLTYHNDNARTGQYLVETALTPANVNTTSFGKLWFLGATAHVDAEPLYAGGVLIPGVGFRNVVIFVSEDDSVYAYDADSTNLFWHAVLLGSGETASDNRGCFQVWPLIGVTGTPVIDRQLGPSGTVFAVAMSKNGLGQYFQRLYALDLATGTNRMPAVAISGRYPGSAIPNSGGYVVFDPAQYKERAGLLLLGGVIYTAWASHCDFDPYTGWIIGYDERTLAQTNIINVTPHGSRGAIWMGNTALAADPGGNIVFLDANGTFDSTLDANGFPSSGNYGNAFLKISTTNYALMVADYFATWNTVAESDVDEDLGSGGAIVLPLMRDANGVARQLAVGAGKDQAIYIVDLANMGKFNPGNNGAIYQQVDGALPSSVFSMPAYFNGTLYYCGNNDSLRAFPFANARLGGQSSQTPGAVGATGATPSVSANGSSNGIVWIVNAVGTAPAVLHALSAANLAVEFYNSQGLPRDQVSGGNKYTTPMIANGKVFFGTTNGVAVFGLLNQSARALVQSLVFVQQPGNGLVGAAVAPEVRVEALDLDDQPVAGVEVTVSLASGSGTLSGTLTRTTDANGIAHFNDLTLNHAGVKVLLATPSFGATGAVISSLAFTVTSPTRIISITINGGGSVTLVYATTAGTTYHIETSTNLAPGSWSVVAGSTTIAGGSSVTFTDASSPRFRQRFYRIVSP